MRCRLLCLIWMAFDGFMIDRRLAGVRDAQTIAWLIAVPGFDEAPSEPKSTPPSRVGACLAA